jgi:hypothetical protein
MGGGWEDKYLRKYKIYLDRIYIYVALFIYFFLLIKKNIYVEVDLGSFPGMAYLVGVWKISKHQKTCLIIDMHVCTRPWASVYVEHMFQE